MIFEPIKSSFLTGAHYDGTNITVQMKSGTYVSEKSISPETWSDWQKTFQSEESSGAFYNKNLRQLGFKKAE